MAQLIQAFDATQYDPTQGAGQLPLGKHPVVIKSSSIEENNAGDGGFLLLNLEIIDGPMKGATGAHRLNLYNKSPKACEIAHRQMSALCHVTGVFRVQASEQLHNIPFVIEVTPQKLTAEQLQQQATGQQVTPYTQVSKVFDMAGNEPGKAPQGQPKPQQGFGQQPQQQPQPQPQQQPQQNWGGQPQGQQPAPQGQGGPAWGGQQPQGQQPQQPPAQQPNGGAAWGQGQQPQQQPQAPAPQPGNWQQNGGGQPQGAAPWGQR